MTRTCRYCICKSVEHMYACMVSLCRSALVLSCCAKSCDCARPEASRIAGRGAVSDGEQDGPAGAGAGSRGVFRVAGGWQRVSPLCLPVLVLVLVFPVRSLGSGAGWRLATSAARTRQRGNPRGETVRQRHEQLPSLCFVWSVVLPPLPSPSSGGRRGLHAAKRTGGDGDLEDTTKRHDTRERKTDRQARREQPETHEERGNDRSTEGDTRPPHHQARVPSSDRAGASRGDFGAAIRVREMD
jgi:hypothetical protein